MSTTIIPEVSKKNPYWISKHRYYELKHFCMQYPQWKKECSLIDAYSKKPPDLPYVQNSAICDSTERCAEAREYYFDRMILVERTAKDTDEILSTYLLKGVTEGISYDILRVRFAIPCCKDTYYNLYRKFFWLLSHARK